MKAKDFIKKHGWEKTRLSLDDALQLNLRKKVKMSIKCEMRFYDFTSILKQYLDAYKLIQDNGGLKEAKEWLQKDIQDEYWDDTSATRERSILLVEEIES